MDSDLWARVKDIFINAVALQGDKREEYIEKTCGSNDELKGEVISLLTSFKSSGAFLDNPDIDLNFAVPQEKDPYLNKKIDAYKIVSVIAEGGMGRVYLGERADSAFSQRVAVKLIKYFNQSSYLLQRFHNERQTLANLNHPYIAKLLDGGSTDEGVPYFIMEYIDGVPLNEYCDANSLSIDDRLLLFQKICSAVNYAHKNLVVHRDLKPSNILITGDGNPKLLDFGISKILKDDNTPDLSDYTVTQVWNLTPDYASPEQIKGEKITTATDIYSLGVLLYKILTGHHPYNIRSYLPADITKIVCETNPEKPSTIIRTVENIKSAGGHEIIISPETIGKARKENIVKLSKTLSGDLDNIILKAIRKEPERRYSSIEQFSEDIRRYLDGLPVIARNDTLSYRTSKFVRRHKFGVAAFLIIIILFIAGFIGITWQADIAAKQRDKARIETAKTEKINTFLQNMLSSADPENSGKDVKVVEVLKKAEKKLDNDLTDQPEINASLRTTIGITLENLGLYDESIIQLKKALETRKKIYGERNEETARSIENLALAVHYKGDYHQAEMLYLKSVKIYEALDSVMNPSYAEALNDLGTLYMDIGKYDSAMTNFKSALNIYTKMLGENNSLIASTLNNMALTSDYEGDLVSAENNYKKALAIDSKLLGNDNYELAHLFNNLAFVLLEKEKYEEALSYFQKSLTIRENKLGKNHPQCILALFNLGCTYSYLNHNGRSIQYIDSALALWSRSLPPDHPLIGSAYYWKGKVLNNENKPDDAITVLRKSLKIRMKKGNENKYYTARTECELGRSLMLTGNYKKAESLILKNLGILKSIYKDDNQQIREVNEILVSLYLNSGQPQKAEQYKALIAKSNLNK